MDLLTQQQQKISIDDGRKNNLGCLHAHLFRGWLNAYFLCLSLALKDVVFVNFLK